MNTQNTPQIPLVIDSTMFTTYRSCPVRFKNEFCHGLAPGRKSVDLHAGGCFARALEVAYDRVYLHSETLASALDLAEVEFHIWWGDFQGPLKTSKTRERMWDAVVAYFREYPPEMDIVRPFLSDGRPTVEFSFAIPLDGEGWPRHPSGDPFIFAGRFDMLAEFRQTGMMAIKDEKTMGSNAGRTWGDMFSVRGQFLGYTWACRRRLGLPLNTVIVRGVVILKTMFHWPQIIKQYPEHMLDKWELVTRSTLARMVDSWSNDKWEEQYSFGDACSSYGGCSFIDLCASDKPERWYPTYRHRTWNPLLKIPEQPAAADMLEWPAAEADLKEVEEV